MDTETVTVQPKGEEFEIIVQHDQTGSAYGITLSKNAYEQLRQHFVSNSIATEYAEFCVRCDREKLPLLCLEDYIKQYCC